VLTRILHRHGLKDIHYQAVACADGGGRLMARPPVARWRRARTSPACCGSWRRTTRSTRSSTASDRGRRVLIWPSSPSAGSCSKYFKICNNIIRATVHVHAARAYSVPFSVWPSSLLAGSSVLITLYVRSCRYIHARAATDRPRKPLRDGPSRPLPISSVSRAGKPPKTHRTIMPFDC
jgi:hypothetical protein